MKEDVAEGGVFKWSSRYLSRGFGQDVIVIEKLAIEYESISACFSVRCGEDGPRPFHLSTISAHRVVAQLGIDFICGQLRTAKEDVGEVWELSYSGTYERPILHDMEIPVSLTLLCRSQRRRMENWLFQFDIADGSFYGTICLAPDKVPIPTNGDIIHSSKHLAEYQEFYYSFYGSRGAAAQGSKAVYRPKACLGLRPKKELALEIRDLAASMASCLQKLFESYNSGMTFGFDASVSKKVSSLRAPMLPSLIRLDVIETRDGLKVVEVNAGNCGGAETYFRMYQFLHGEHFPNASKVPFLLGCFLQAIASKPGRAVFTYLEDQSKYLCLARQTIYGHLAPHMRIDVMPLPELLGELRSGKSVDLIYRDFVYEVLGAAGEVGTEAERLFISDARCPPYFPSFSDEILSDKAYISEIDHHIRHGLGGQLGFSEADIRSWQRWLAPCATSTRIFHQGGEPDFEMPEGVVLKPADGYGGDRVFIFPTCSLPMNRSFYGQTRWVVQKFFDSPRYLVPRETKGATDKVHLAHGVFLMPYDGKLQYAGTFTRLSPDLVVNIKNDGDVVLFCEPEWFS
jgi:hypothetical protein